MADCQKEFEKFHDVILLSQTQEQNLRTGRDALRDKITKYYQSKGQKLPVFCWQGSFSMKTTIYQKDEDYDLDDGVYLQHLPERKEDWPTTETIHKEIIDAVDEHTDTPPIDKTSCIRVQYKNEYHIDLAVYGEFAGKVFLARNGSEQWKENNPKLFKDWFDQKLKSNGEPFRTIIKYIKKWAYYNNYTEITGFLITILVGNNFSNIFPDSDEKTLRYTIENVVNDLKINQKIIRPVYPYKNMTEDMTENQFKSLLIDRFISFLDLSRKAIDETDKDKSCDYWQELFGESFPDNLEKNKNENKSKGPTIIVAETRPWRKQLLQ